MKPEYALIPILVIVAALPVIAGGCDNNEMAEEPGTQTGQLAKYLNVLPDDESIVSVYYIDIEYLENRQQRYPQAGIYPYLHIAPIAGSGLFGFYYETPRGEQDPRDEYRESIGITAENVDRMIVAGEAPHTYQALGGTFDTGEVEAAVTSGPMNDLLETTDHGGYRYYRWDEDDAVNLSRQTSLRPLGRGHRLAIVDNFAFWTTWDAGIEAMIDAHSDTITSIADTGNYRLLIEELERQDIFCAYLSDHPSSAPYLKSFIEQQRHEQSMDQSVEDQFYRALDDFPLLKPYDAFATAAGLDQQGYYLTIVLVHPDDNTATKNAALLEERIEKTEFIRKSVSWMSLIDDMEIRSEGRIVTARLYGEIGQYWGSIFYSLDDRSAARDGFEPLIVHE